MVPDNMMDTMMMMMMMMSGWSFTINRTDRWWYVGCYYKRRQDRIRIGPLISVISGREGWRLDYMY